MFCPRKRIAESMVGHKTCATVLPGAKDRLEDLAFTLHPDLGKIAPTGQPPTCGAGSLPSAHRRFAGSLEDLTKACAEANPTTVWDLGNSVVTAQIDVLSTHSRADSGSLYGASHLDDDAAICGDSGSVSGSPATSISEAPSPPGTPIGPVGNKLLWKTDGPSPLRQNNDLMGVFQAAAAVLLQDSVQPQAPLSSAALDDGLKPRASFSSVFGDLDTLADDHSVANSELPAVDSDAAKLLLKLNPDTVAALKEPVEVSNNDLTAPVATPTVITADASVRVRDVKALRRSATPSHAGSPADLKASCEFDSKLLEDLLHPSTTCPVTAVVQLSASGVTVRNGTISLPDGAVLVLSGDDLVLEDVTICGKGCGVGGEGSRSLPLVYVDSGSVTMTGVKIEYCAEGHGLGVGPGAVLELEECALTHNRTCGLVVKGEGARVVATDCTFEGNGQDGAVVLGGGHAEFVSCSFLANKMLGLGVLGAQSVVRVQGGGARGNGSHGVAVTCGGRAGLQEASVTGNQGVGVVALDEGCVVTGDKCEFKGNAEGIHVEAAQATFTETHIIKHTIGAQVHQATGKLELFGCTVARVDTAGVQVGAGGFFYSAGSRIQQCGASGVAVQHQGSKVLMQDVKVAQAAHAVNVTVAGCAEMHRCHLSDNSIAALQATGQGTTASLFDCNLSSNHVIGAFVSKAASVFMEKCCLSGNRSSGCETRDRHTSIRLADCTVQSNGRVGCYAHSAASMDLVKSEVSGNGSFALLAGSRAAPNDSHALGGGTITHDRCIVAGRTMKRHGGRMFDKCVDSECCG